MPKVSVILTSYNHEKYIGQAIESVLCQTFIDFELFIIDDCSSDNSWDVICRYEDSRIMRIRNEYRKTGIPGVNEVIQEMASGEYIAIHNSDDVWREDKLQKQVDILDGDEHIGACFTIVDYIDDNDNVRSSDDLDIFAENNRTRHEWLRYFITNGNALCHPSVLIRKKCYEECGSYPYGMVQLPDMDMWVRLCIRYEIYIIPEACMKYRVLGGLRNASAPTIDTMNRISFELYEVYKNLFVTECVNDVLKIYPEAKEHIHEEEYIAQYLMAMMLIKHSWHISAKLLGLDMLYSILNDADKIDRLESLHKFTPMEFEKLTRTYGLSNRTISEVEADKEYMQDLVSKMNSPWYLLKRFIRTFVDRINL